MEQNDLQPVDGSSRASRASRSDLEEALRISEEKFSKIFRMSPDAIDLVRTSDRVCVDINRAFTNLYGFTPADFVGQPLLPADMDLWVNREDRDRLMARVRECGEALGFEAPLRRKDGSIFIAEISTSTLEIDGEPYHLSVTRDITERKRAEEEKARLQARLLQSQKMESLGILAGGIAHDMNNVLGAILGIASASIESQVVDGPTHRALGTIIKATERGGMMLKSLLSFARMNPAREQELDLNGLFHEAMQLLECTALARVRLEMDLASDLRPIRGDASALINAFMNLCVNAVDAMPDNGLLAIRTRNLDERRVEVQVEDTGTGMSPELLDKVMDPFFTTKPPGKGTGLGLSTVYSTVKAHHGELRIQSQPGRGTLVRMQFPAGAGVAVPEPAVAPGLLRPIRSLMVQLVDDDELIRSSMQMVLEGLGHASSVAASGEEALAELASGFRPDVVILDMNMPGLGGAGTLSRLRALHPALPVLLATGRVDQAVLDLVAADPWLTLLSKPFSMKELQSQLERVGPVT